jgi:hypothetical protein
MEHPPTPANSSQNAESYGPSLNMPMAEYCDSLFAHLFPFQGYKFWPFGSPLFVFNSKGNDHRPSPIAEHFILSYLEAKIELIILEMH